MQPTKETLDTKNYPKPKELKEFARRFDKDQWLILCNSQEFLDTVLEDLGKSGPLAEKILAKTKKV